MLPTEWLGEQSADLVSDAVNSLLDVLQVTFDSFPFGSHFRVIFQAVDKSLHGTVKRPTKRRNANGRCFAPGLAE